MSQEILRSINEDGKVEASEITPEKI